MLLIPCPWCGEREEAEFHNGGEAHIKRPADPDKLSDEEWAEPLMHDGPVPQDVASVGWLGYFVPSLFYMQEALS